MSNREDPLRVNETPTKKQAMNEESPKKDTERQKESENSPKKFHKVQLIRLDQSLVSIAARFIWKFSTENNPRSKEYFKIKSYLRGRANLINHKNISYYALKEGPLYTGVAYGIDFKNFLGEKGCRIMSLFVDQMHRGKGLSKILMKFYMKRAKCLGFRRIKLDCYFDNTKAQNLYHKLGFRFCSELYTGRKPIRVTNYLEDNVTKDVFEMLEKRYAEEHQKGAQMSRSEGQFSGSGSLASQPARSPRKSVFVRRESRIIAPGSQEHKQAYHKLQPGKCFTNLLKPSEDILKTEDIIFKLLINKASSPFPKVLDEEKGTFTGPSPATLYIVDNLEPSKVLGLVGLSNMTSTSKNKFIPHVTHILVQPGIQNIDTVVVETVETILKICLQDWGCYEVIFEVEEHKNIDGCFRIQDLLPKTFDCRKEYCGVYEIDFGAKD